MNTAEIALPQQLRLEGELTIYRAAELLAAIRDAIGGAASCTFDLDAVTEVDSAGVQLLLAAKRTARESNCELTFIGHSAPLVEALNVFGLAEAFGAASATNERVADAPTLNVEHAYGS
jgi:anti-anti-sigma factor